MLENSQVSFVPHPPKIQGAISSTHRSITKPALNPVTHFGLMSLMVPFLCSVLPSNQALPVIRSLREERKLVGQDHVCVVLSLPLYQAGSQPLRFSSGNICLVSRLSKPDIFQNPEHLDGIVHRKKGTMLWRTKMQKGNS